MVTLGLSQEAMGSGKEGGEVDWELSRAEWSTRRANWAEWEPMM